MAAAAFTDARGSMGPSSKQHGDHIPTIGKDLETWAQKNKTSTFAKNLMRNVKYYSTPAKDAAYAKQMKLATDTILYNIDGDSTNELQKAEKYLNFL